MKNSEIDKFIVEQTDNRSGSVGVYYDEVDEILA